MRIEDFTDLTQVRVRDGKSRLVLSSRDTKGLNLIVRPNGRKEWHCRFTLIDGRRNTVKLGDYPTMQLIDAAKAANEITERVKHGENPVESLRRERNKARAAKIAAALVLDDKNTVAAISERFLRHKAETIRATSVKKYRQSINVHLIPAFADMDIRHFDRLAYERFLSELSRESKSAARLSHAAMRAMLSFAVDEGTLTANPLLGLKRFNKLTEVAPRAVTLTGKDIYALLQNELGLPAEERAVCEIQLRTGLRIGEIVSIRWPDVDLRARTITHSESVMKSGKAAITVMPDQVRKLIADQRRQMQQSTGDRLFSDHITADRISRVLSRGGLDWRTHDLRRTMRSHLQRMGCPQEIRAAITNHATPNGVAKHYDHGETLKQQLHWLTLWGAELDKVNAHGPSVLEAQGIELDNEANLLAEFGDLL